MRSKTYVVHSFSKLDVAIALGRVFPHPDGMAVCRHHVEVGDEPEDFSIILTYEVDGSDEIVEPKL
jgi:hypothetical protein